MHAARHRRFHRRRNRIGRLPGTGSADVLQTVHWPFGPIALHTVHAHSEEFPMTMSFHFELQRFAQSAPATSRFASTGSSRSAPMATFELSRRLSSTRRARMASVSAARRRLPARFELRASRERFRTPAMNTKTVDKLTTRVATETVLSEFARFRLVAAVARPGVRTLVRYGLRGRGLVHLPHNHLLIRARGNLAAWIGARGRRIPTGSNAL